MIHSQPWWDSISSTDCFLSQIPLQLWCQLRTVVPYTSNRHTLHIKHKSCTWNWYVGSISLDGACCIPRKRRKAQPSAAPVPHNSLGVIQRLWPGTNTILVLSWRGAGTVGHTEYPSSLQLEVGLKRIMARHCNDLWSRKNGVQRRW